MNVFKIFSGPGMPADCLAASLKRVFQVLLSVTVICQFVPFSPGMPSVGTDASWVFGINQAVSQGLAFGTEVIFTYGPYASIYTRGYHPATDSLILATSLCLGFSYALAVLLVARRSQWYVLAILWFALSGLMSLTEALFLSYPLLLGLYCYPLIFDDEQDPARKSRFILPFLFFILGLLPLIKGTFIILSGTVSGLCVVFFLSKKKYQPAFSILFSQIVSIVFFWLLSGQLLEDLPYYFINMLPLVSAYSESMSINGIAKDIYIYISVVLFLFFSIYKIKKTSITEKLFLFFVFYVYLFISFKAGFVRHDAHAIIAGTAIVISSSFLPLLYSSRYTLIVSFFSLIACVSIQSHYAEASTEKILKRMASTYSSAWTGLINRVSRDGWLEDAYSQRLAKLNEEAKFPSLQGTTDVYSFDQTYLIASGNTWNPRPVMQSYSVYTPSLAEKNRKHLVGENAPDHILFRVAPKDGRIPALEDGASWPELLTRYSPSKLKSGFLFLHRKPPQSETPVWSLLEQRDYAFGETVSVAGRPSPLFVELSIDMSLMGRLVNFLYKPTHLVIILELENGTKRMYRIISGMAKSGLLISPLVENTAEFGALYIGETALSHKKVTSFTIVPAGARWQWKHGFNAVIKTFTAAT